MPIQIILLVLFILFMTFTIWACCVASARVDRNNTHIDSEVYRKGKGKC